MTRLENERAHLREFGATVGCDSARSLNLLRDIEETNNSLDRLTKHLMADVNYAEKYAEEVAEIEHVIDPDGEIAAVFMRAEGAVLSLYEVLVEKRSSAIADTRLKDSDGVVDGFSSAIAAAADLHNAMDNLRAVIGEHDADREHVVSAVATTAEELDAMFDGI